MIHCYRLAGLNLVLDVNSGAVHLLDEPAYDLTQLLTPPLAPELPAALCEELSQHTPESLRSAYAELYSLWKAGTLWCEDIDFAALPLQAETTPIKALCLNVAHDCNMRCRYCFAGTGEYHGHRSMMTQEVANAAIDFVLTHSGTRHNLEVDFFGGEPLMNFELVKATVAYARSREAEFNKLFRFTITTNGVLLTDDKIDFINAEMSNVVLSVDGRPEVNDRIRTRLDGKSAYAAVMPRFRKLVERRGEGQYYVRGTFTRYNLDFAEDVLHLYRQGFDQVSVEPVVADPAVDYALTEEMLPQICAEYERLARELLKIENEGGWLNFFHFMLDLENGPCAIKRVRGCGCGREYVAVTPDGELYPCHQFVGYSDWRMGNVLDGSFDKGVAARFADCNVLGKPACRDCWAKLYCSGGCSANAMIYNSSIQKPHALSCELERKRVEVAICLQALRMLREN